MQGTATAAIETSAHSTIMGNGAKHSIPQVVEPLSVSRYPAHYGISIASPPSREPKAPQTPKGLSPLL
jgi:hypothetical protein